MSLSAQSILLPLRSCIKCNFSVAQLDTTSINPSISEDISSLIGQLKEQQFHISPSELRSVAQTNYLAVAEIKDEERSRVIGMGCLVSMHLPQGIRLLIESVVVDENFRGRGVGTAIVQHLLHHASLYGDGHVSLTCNHKRSEARRLYFDLGFQEASTSVLRKAVGGCFEAP